MAFFSPYALQAGVEGQDIATTLRRRALQAQQEENTLKEQQAQMRARRLLGEVLQGFGGQRQNPMYGIGGQGGGALPPGAGAIPQSPAPGQSSVPMERGGENRPFQTAAPAAPSSPSAEPTVGGSPAQPAVAAPAGAGAMPEIPFSWRAVAEEVRKRTDADPATIFAAMQEVMPQIEKESDREAKAALGEAQLQQKRESLMANLQWRYYNSDSQTERTQILADMRKLTTDMQGRTARDVAGINANAGINRANIAAASAANVAQIGAQSREAVAAQNNATRDAIARLQVRSLEQRAADANALKKELGEASLDLKADQIAKTFLYKEREQQLKREGMTNQQAQFWAKYDLQKSIAAARDETTRRGQDMLQQNRQMAFDARRDAEQGKVEAAMPAVLDNFDSITRTAEKLLTHPGMDNATGPLDQYLPTVQGDTANFEAIVDTLKSMVGFQALADMRAASPTGGALGNVSNQEVKFLQNSIASLALSQTAEQFQENLRAIMDNASRAKARTLQAYETRFKKPTAAGGAVPVATPKPNAKTITVPASVPKGARKQVDGKWYTARGDGTAVEE